MAGKPKKRTVRCVIGSIWLPDGKIIKKNDVVELDCALADHLISVGNAIAEDAIAEDAAETE